MCELPLLVRAEPGSDSWGFVGVVDVGLVEAYRTLEAFPTPAEASAAAEGLVAELFGALLAAQEWRAIRADRGELPTRDHFHFSVMHGRGGTPASDPRADCP